MNNSRALFIILAAILSFAAIVVKLADIQIVMHDEYARIAMNQHDKESAIAAERGSIMDRNGVALAYTKNEYRAVVFTPKVNEKKKDTLAAQLSQILGKSKAHYLKLIASKQGEVVVGTKISADDAIKLRRLVTLQVEVREDFTRSYPYDRLASHVLGFVNKNEQGVSGVEVEFNKYLTGVPGLIVYERDGTGAPISVREEFSYNPRKGNSVVLTIDNNIQAIAEEELRKGIQEFGGTSASAVVMDPNTGEILAIANYPDYSPAAYFNFDDPARRNRAVMDSYEPGSTIKSIVLSALLQEKLVSPEEIINVENGAFRYKTVNIYDTHRFDKLTVREILQESSNIGMVKLSERISSGTFYKYLRDFGFGNVSTIELPGETTGYLKKPKEFGSLTKAFMSHGYEVSVTPVQMTAAFSALVNGGYLYKPTIVKKIIDPSGAPVKSFEPLRLRQVVDEKISVQIRQWMEDVVEKGTGSAARVANISIGGKTGTAQMYTGSGYSNEKYNASFIGFFPVEKPKYTVFVLVTSPDEGKYGGRVAAPVFSGIAEKISALFPEDIPVKESDLNEDHKTLIAQTESNIEAATYMNPEKEEANIEEVKNEIPAVMPDLTKLSRRRALGLLNGAGLEIEIEGAGVVVYQSIPVGRRLEPGMKCVIKCERSR